MKNTLLLIPLCAMLLASCSSDTPYMPVTSGEDDTSYLLNLPNEPYNYSNIQPPDYFFTNDGSALPSSVNGIDNTPANNPITDDGATLGRVLFYDPNLSLNRAIACASCHRTEKSFADSGPLSQGLMGDNTKRNSPTLINTRFYKRGRFFYDERAATLEDQVIMPMLDHTEMRMDETLVIQRINEQPYYRDLFLKAFNDTHVSVTYVRRALAQFVRSMVSFNSKYDAGRAQAYKMTDPFNNFTDEENRGKDLFMKPFSEGGLNCYACHTTEAFVSANMGPINNGLDAVSTTDMGAYDFYTGNVNMTGAFKTPTLRNIALTAPYMHDGRFATLNQVIEFYNSGVQNHAQLSPLLKGTDGLPRKLNLSEADKAALIHFLYTLTDTSVQADVRWSSPFINQHL